MDSFRKAYGALKDSTKVGLAKVNSEFKDLDIAIVKATNHTDCPPKERHVRKILAAVSITAPRADVSYCIHALSKRLAKTRCWIVAMKTLIVYHRILRESDSSFREELLRYSRRGTVFQMANFKDDSGPLAWDCSGCVRTYAFFLEERLECFKNLNFDILSEKSKANSDTQQAAEDVLGQLPALQQLLYRIICCQPEGLARHNFLIQYALALVVKESFKVYCAINDRIISLVDMFFEMPKHEAIVALDIYKKAGRQADHLSAFYDFCKTLDLAQTFQFPTLRQPPPSFLATMEDYIKEAPSVSHRTQEDQEKKEEPENAEEPTPENAQNIEKNVDSQEESVSETREVNPPVASAEEPVDLLGLNEINVQATQIEESNALALAIIEPGNNPPPTNNSSDYIGNLSGWELALVTTPSNLNNPQVAQNKMLGGFDKSLLNSLYEDDVARRQIQMHSAGYTASHGSDMTPTPNLFNQHDPFAISNNFAPPINVQMAAMIPHQQQMMMQQQQMMMMQQQQQQNMMMMVAPHYPHSAQYSQQQMPMRSTNPFEDPFLYPGNTMPPNGNRTLL